MREEMLNFKAYITMRVLQYFSLFKRNLNARSAEMPTSAATNPNHHRSHEYHTTFIGFVTAAKAPPERGRASDPHPSDHHTRAVAQGIDNALRIRRA